MLNLDKGQQDLYSDLHEQLVPKAHVLRKVLELIDFTSICKDLHDCYCPDNGAPGLEIERGFKALFLQQFEDVSDRRMANHLEDSLSAKMFCGFGLHEDTPKASFFSKLRTRIGVERMVSLFNKAVQQLKDKGVVKSSFHFLDSTAVISKISLWEEYDQAIADKECPSLCNQNISKYAVDEDARIGCKGKNKFWFGYKRHQLVDMVSGVITKVKVTPANAGDAKSGAEILPETGMVFADKAYDTNEFQATLVAKGLHSGVIKKNNRKDKNRDKDRWVSSMRMPFEGLFSKADKRAPYRGLAKVEFHQTLDAFVQNCRRLVVMGCNVRIA
jgi:IS5 family transposase